MDAQEEKDEQARTTADVAKKGDRGKKKKRVIKKNKDKENEDKTKPAKKVIAKPKKVVAAKQ